MTRGAAERIEMLEEILEKCEEIAGLIHNLDDKRLEAYHLATVEGTQRGWLGSNYLVDDVREAIDALLHPDEEEEEEEEAA
jgi:hypothetical protein